MPSLMSKNPNLPQIQFRPFCQTVADMSQQLGLSHLQAALVAHRITQQEVTDLQGNPSLDKLEQVIFPKLKHLQSPQQLKNATQAAQAIADAIEGTGKIILSTDYDTDGVTSAWVATQALIDYFGVQKKRIVHLIGERKNGYGISDEVVNQILAIDEPIDLVISADQGSSDEPRITRLAQAGIAVCVTDHHQIPPEGVPSSALCTVNPQQKGCDYDKTVAGCFVIFLVMGQTRQELIKRGRLPKDAASLKNLALNVALGTIADSVSLKSPNNRAIVQAGLALINRLENPAWQAVFDKFAQPQQTLDAEFLGFQVATRINAASRVGDVTTAFKFLNADNLTEAKAFLSQLDEDNQLRRDQQADMLLQAQTRAAQLYQDDKYSLVIKMTGNAGIQGIIASRIGEAYGVPTIAMTDMEDGTFTGSGRGIVSSVDLREAFQWMSEQETGLFISMGGHKGAVGCMINGEQFDRFAELFEQAIQQQLGDQIPTLTIESDGELHPNQLVPELINEIQLLEPFGREWPQPIFSGQFRIIDIRAVGQNKTHLSCRLQPVITGENRYFAPLQAIYFNALENDSQLPFHPQEQVLCAYQPTLNHFYGRTNLQLKIQHLEKAI